MRLGILADTHNEIDRTRHAIQKLCDAGAEALVHCGDLASPDIVELLAVRPSWFVFGNHDADNVPELQEAAKRFGPVCLGWSGVIELGGRRIGITHGHMTVDVRRVLTQQPDFLLCGHAHIAGDVHDGTVRRINPGALHRADEFTVALLELPEGRLTFLRIPESV